MICTKASWIEAMSQLHMLFVHVRVVVSSLVQESVREHVQEAALVIAGSLVNGLWDIDICVRRVEKWITQVKLDLKMVLLYRQDFVLHVITIAVWVAIQHVREVAQQNVIMVVVEVVEIIALHLVSVVWAYNSNA